MSKLSTRESIGYCFGDVGSNLTNTFANIFLLIFYTDVFGISPAQAATLFLVARIWDAINDPIVGYFVDRTNTKNGRFKPYIGIAALPVALFGVAMFTVPDLGPDAKLVYAYVTYIGYGMVYSLMSVPYISMISALSEDSKARTKLVGIRSALVMLFSATMAGIPALVDLLGGGDPAVGYQRTMMVYASVGFLMHVYCYRSVTEHIQVAGNDQEERVSFKQVVSYLGQNKPLLILFALFFAVFGNSFITTSSGIYLLTYLFEAKDIFPLFVVCQLLCIVFGVLLSRKLVDKYDPKWIFVAGALLAATRTIAVYSGDLNTFLAFVPHSSLGQGFMVGVIWGFVPDAIEYGRQKTGLNIVGIGNSLIGFFLKCGAAVGGIVPGFMLEIYNYVPNAAQSEETLIGIKHMSGTFPLAILVVVALIASAYPLTQKKLKEVIVA